MASFPGLMILLVEGDPGDVLLVQRARHRSGWTQRLGGVPDGEAAIAHLAGQIPCDDRRRYPLPWLILPGIKLPRKSGLEVLARLREQPELKCLPVAMLISSAQSKDIHHAYELGGELLPGQTGLW